MKIILITILIIFVTCSKKTEVVILDENYYMEEIKSYAKQCGFDVNCMNNKIRNNIPKKYYVHVRRIKVGWEFACIDTTLPGHKEELKKARYAAMGY